MTPEAPCPYRRLQAAKASQAIAGDNLRRALRAAGEAEAAMEAANAEVAAAAEALGLRLAPV